MHQKWNNMGIFTELTVPGFIFYLLGGYPVQKGHIYLSGSFGGFK